MPEIYPDKIMDRIGAVMHGGSSALANTAGGSANFECGSAIKVSLQIEGEEIVDAKFLTSGCGFAIAAADVLANYLSGKHLSELHGFDANEKTADLGEFPSDRESCFRMALEAFRAALADHRSRLIEEFTGEKALICTCFGVTEEKIESVVAVLERPSLDAVAKACNAGSGCGSCRMIIEELIDQHTKAI